jgi:hypothetical protein
VSSDPGGRTIIVPGAITNEHLAGCITTDQLTPGPNKDPVVTSTTVAIVRSGLQTINGIALQEGDRVLVKDQDDPSENGIYIASAATGLWVRAPDADEDAQMPPGITVVDPSTGTAYYLDATAPVVLGSSALRFLSLGGRGGSSQSVVLYWEEADGGSDVAIVPGPMGLQGVAGAPGAGGVQGPQGPPGIVPDESFEEMPWVPGSSAAGDIRSNGSVPFVADQSMGNHNLTNVADPVNAQDAVNVRSAESISVLTNGDATTPEIMFDATGDVIMTGI